MSPHGRARRSLLADQCARCRAPILFEASKTKVPEDVLCPGCADRERRALVLSAATQVMICARRLERQNPSAAVEAENLRDLAGRMRDLVPPPRRSRRYPPRKRHLEDDQPGG